MHNDFHYGVIKVLAKTAGFKESEAETIAYASQHVDDSHMHNPINLDVDFDKFRLDKTLEKWLKAINCSETPDKKIVDYHDSGSTFDPICTLHKNLEYAHAVQKGAQRKVYMSFHFLPAEIWKENQEDYCFVTKPNSKLANHLVDSVISGSKKMKDRKLALVALGISLHSFADTFSHEGFSGRWDAKDNNLCTVKINGESPPLSGQMLLGKVVPVGHLDAAGYPDNIHDEVFFDFARGGFEVNRKNESKFLIAAQKIYNKLIQFNGNANNSSNFAKIKPVLKKSFSINTSPDQRLYYMEDRFSATDELKGIKLTNYNPVLWERKAVSLRSKFDLDSGNQLFKLLGNKNSLWFKWHVAAAAQRAFVKENIDTSWC